MKLRNGFVSNSSSSSFVIIKPPGTAKDVVEKHRAVILEEIYNFEMYNSNDTEIGDPKAEEQLLAEAEKELEKILSGRGVFTGGGDCEYEIGNALYSIFKANVIATISVGSDEGGVTFVTIKELEKKIAQIKGETA